MKKQNQIKKQIKKQKLWVSYKTRFEHKQMRLLFSRIALMLDEEINLKFLLDQELKLINIEKSQKMFTEVFQSLNDKIDFECDWEIFANFVWYVYQTSTFWNDSKKGILNLFTVENHLQKNQEKRDLYQSWINSIDKQPKDFNLKVIKISRMVF